MTTPKPGTVTSGGQRWTYLAVPEPTGLVLRDLINEQDRAEVKFPDQHIPDGTPPDAERMGLDAARETAERTRDFHRTMCQRAARQGRLTWRHVLAEEFYEALAEDNPDRLRAELIQVANVAVRWVKDIDRRQREAADVLVDSVLEEDAGHEQEAFMRGAFGDDVRHRATPPEATHE